MKTIVLLSGGIDSSVALAEAISLGHECSCVFFEYRQRAFTAEWTASRAIANHYGCAIASCYIDGLFWDDTAFLTGGTDPRQAMVPARNLVMISFGIAAALRKGAGEVWIGCNLNDATDYPDCTPDFVSAMSQAAAHGTNHTVCVRAPHVLRTKAEVIRKGIELGVPLHLTTSCSDTSGRCGVCKACDLRRKSYAEIDGAYDHVTYLTGNG